MSITGFYCSFWNKRATFFYSGFYLACLLLIACHWLQKHSRARTTPWTSNHGSDWDLVLNWCYSILEIFSILSKTSFEAIIKERKIQSGDFISTFLPVSLPLIYTSIKKKKKKPLMKWMLSNNNGIWFRITKHLTQSQIPKCHRDWYAKWK